MVPRYTLPEMGKIWSDENRFKIWLEIEVLACEAQAEIGSIPKAAAKEIREKANFNVARILEIEETTKHDVIAFLTNVEEYVGEVSRYIHLGMTSSDILDTCTAVQMKQAGEILLNDLITLKEVLARRAKEFKHTLCIGRSHGIHAEPITFGLKLLLWYEECKRNIERMQHAVENISYGKISGAVGTFEHLSSKVEELVCENLGLKPAPISTQIIQRDRHAQFLNAIALSGSMLEKIATEIRHLQRTEVQEVEEFFSSGQKGSSAMPHKRNPISSENICGQARLLRTNALAAIENNALWHERDISHSSVERVILPDSTISLDYILNRTIKLINKLVVYPNRMKENLELTKGLIFSQKVLLELAKKGLKRQEAYVLVQKSAMKTFNEKRPFIETLLENNELMQHITDEEIKSLFNFDKIMENADFIFKRCELD
jgi:adenylosuccinate lyase